MNDPELLIEAAALVHAVRYLTCGKWRVGEPEEVTVEDAARDLAETLGICWECAQWDEDERPFDDPCSVCSHGHYDPEYEKPF